MTHLSKIKGLWEQKGLSGPISAIRPGLPCGQGWGKKFSRGQAPQDDSVGSGVVMQRTWWPEAGRVGVNSIISTPTPTPTPTPEVSTPTPTPANLQNFNSNSNSGGFNSNSNSNSGKSSEYQLQLQFQLRRFELQFQLQLRSWSWSWTQLQLQLRSWPQPWKPVLSLSLDRIMDIHNCGGLSPFALHSPPHIYSDHITGCTHVTYAYRDKRVSVQHDIIVPRISVNGRAALPRFYS